MTETGPEPPPAPPVEASATYAQADEWFDTPVPEFYTDTLNVSLGPYGVSVTFGTRHPRGPVSSSRVHMSHQMAVVMERLFRRLITSYELEQGSPIAVQASILAELRLSDDDMAALEQSRRKLVGRRPSKP